MSAVGPGPAELMILVMFLTGFGLPVGVPPEVENPAMAYVAPEECVLYATWSGMAAADPESKNQTEQLLAEPEVKEFARALEKSLRDGLKRLSQDNDDPQTKQMARIAPLWAKTVLTRSTALFATKIAVKDGQPEIEGGVLVDAGDNAKALAEGLVQALSSEETRAQEVMIGKQKFFRFAAQPWRGEVTVGAAGNFLLVGVGKGVVEGMVERVKAKQVPAWLADVQQRFNMERRASLAYVNTPALVDAFLPLAGPDGQRLADSLGLLQVGAFESATGLDQEGMVSRTLLHIDKEPQGLLLLLNGEGIKPAQVDFLPKDATFAGAFSLSSQQVYNVLAQIIAANAPPGSGGLDQAADGFEDAFGMRLKEDLLPALGDVWTISMSPADGWFGVVATVEVKDRARLTEVFEKVQAMLADHPQAKIQRSKFGVFEMQTLAIPGMPFRPAWCVTDARLIIGLQAQTVKAQLRAKPEEVGLFSQPEFAAAFQGKGSTIVVGYQDSAKLFEATYGYLSLVLPIVQTEMDREMPQVFDVNSLPSARSIHRHLRPGFSVTKRTAAGLESESQQTFPTPNVGASAPVAVALLLPAVQAARSAARRTQSQNNLKQIMLALHNYHDANKTFPPSASADKEGKPLLSWRVMILPYIEQEPLFRQFHLDEPWDSAHNKQLIAHMPEIYKSPASTAGAGKTVYLGVGGDNGTFPPIKKPADGRNRGLSLSLFRDGISNTIAILEVGNQSAVDWTKPDDYIPDEKDPKQGLLGLYPGGFNAAFVDGSVRFFREDTPSKTLLNLYDRRDGNVVELD